ncbi:MAG: FitA-like ribbon-helix-helix domain-containing protein [Nesterenkonia sp.]
MAAISVRGLSEDISARLKVRAARHGRSMEAEVRVILTETLADEEHDRPNLAQAVRRCFAEIDYGIARLSEGRRKGRLSATAADVFPDFDDVILPLDARAARRYADIVVRRERVGTPITMADAQVAAICAAQEATLATRNTDVFESTGVTLFNPWTG